MGQATQNSVNTKVSGTGSAVAAASLRTASAPPSTATDGEELRIDLHLNFDVREHTQFFGKEFPSEHVFCIENPYCTLEEARQKQDTLPLAA